MHSNNTSWPKIGLAFALAAAACASQASIVMVTSAADLAALPRLISPVTDSFDDLAPSFAASPTPRALGSYSYQASASGGLFGAGVGSDGWLSTNLSGTTLLLSAFGGGVSVIGGYFFGSDITGQFEAGNDITLTVTDTLGATLSETISGAALNSFRGFATSDAKLVSLAISIASNGSFATVNDLIIGQIPEPTSLALALAALAGAAAAVNRRKQRAAPACAAT